MTSFRGIALLGFILYPCAGLWSLGPVVISEVHYHPLTSQGELLEFLELHNSSSHKVDLVGWRLKGAVEYTFAAGAVLESGTYALVCRDSDAFQLIYGGVLPEPVGTYDGALDNGGEAIDLVDAWGAIRDSVPYDDELPWPEAADGGGSSLQRLCEETPGRNPLNWTAAPPSPGGPSPLAACPPPAYQSPGVVISEIQYHPRESGEEHPAVEDGEDEEFIEIYNVGDSERNIGGWRFEDGVRFTFPLGTMLAPGESLVVCRNEDRIREKYGVPNSLGDYEGRLSNEGERVLLVDLQGNYVDSVLYSQNGEWPYVADGVGHSLERVVLTLSAQDPANWAASVPTAAGYHTRSAEGGLGQGLVQTFVLTIDGEGEVLVDNVVLDDLEDPGVNLLENGAFEADLDGWSAKGLVIGSQVESGVGVGSTKALRLVSSGSCPDGECSAANGVSQSVEDTKFLSRYRVTVDFQYVWGSPIFRAGFFRGAAVEAGDLQTPGKPNAVAADRLPIHISKVHRFVREPTSADTTWITALVRNATAPQVELSYSAGDRRETLGMRDDGAHRDGDAGDGVYGVELPAFEHNTQVLFRVTASEGDRIAQWPYSRFPDTPLPEEYAGYYVNDLQVDSPLPVYQILIDGLDPADVEANPQSVNQVLSCWSLTTGSFACKGDLFPAVKIRFRGNTACFIQKRNFKVIFNRTAPFHGLRKFNLNGLWTDKAIVREHLAWEFFREIGAPYTETEFVRVHVNGVYHGLFMYLEHPGKSFLDRNGLDSGGNLYKASPLPSLGGSPLGVELWPNREYRRNWERETNEAGDFSDLAAFIGAMHADGKSGGGPTGDFWKAISFEKMIVRYQIGQVVLNNIDSFAKNHFLYHDLEKNKWSIITWDMDLTFGKFFSGEAIASPERPVGTLNDLMLSDPGIQGDLNPWFAATVNDNQRLNWFIDFFFRAGGGYYRRAYLVRLWNVLQEKYRNGVYELRLDDLAMFLAGEAAEDYERWGRYASNVPDFPDGMLDNIEIVKKQIQLHRDFLLAYFRDWHAEIMTQPTVKITEIMYLPEQGDEHLEFLEILNTSGETIDLSGWSIAGIKFQFPPGATVSADEPFIVAKSPDDFRARYSDRSLPHVFGPYEGRLDNGGEEITVLDSGPGCPATIDYIRYDNKSPWPTVLPGYSIELNRAFRETDNDAPQNWVRSESAGGSPETVFPPFVRGNADGGDNGSVNLTDGIFILEHLFRGGLDPPCDDAADVNDDGNVDITDAIFVLNFLFLGGSEPPAPYPEKGVDPTPDELTCRG